MKKFIAFLILASLFTFAAVALARATPAAGLNPERLPPGPLYIHFV